MSFYTAQPISVSFYDVKCGNLIVANELITIQTKRGGELLLGLNFGEPTEIGSAKEQYKKRIAENLARVKEGIEKCN